MSRIKMIAMLTVAAFIIVTIISSFYYMFGRGNVNALWEIVNEQCVPNQEENNNPAPCIKVNREDKYALFKDAKGPAHDLVIPSYKITGIESPELQLNSAPSFFAYAWSERGNLEEEIGRPLDDSTISIAVNSRFGRSQDQLHIHLSCLKSEVFEVLGNEKIDEHWEPLQQKIEGHKYIAKKLSGTDLEKEEPFKILGKYVESINDKIDYYGLAVSFMPDGSAILLATRVDLLDLSFGSTGEIQDYSCVQRQERTN